MKRIISILLIISIMVVCSSCGGEKVENKPYSNFLTAFDTTVSYTIYDNLTKSEQEEIRKKIHSTCSKFDYAFDKYTPNSFVTNINRDKVAKAMDDNNKIIKESIKYSKTTNGAFDITVSPLVELWGVNSNHFKVPRNMQIRRLMSKVNYNQIEVKGNFAYLTNKGSIDLGAIAKGYVADKLAKTLKKMNVKSAILDLGGNIYAIGSKDGKAFTVGINKPFQKGQLIAKVKVKDKAVVTAGIDQRYKERDGKIYPHIIDPKTGRPIDNDLNSVTVISKNATAADALSTGFMVMGLDKGLALANKTNDIEAVFIDKDNKLHLTDGLKINNNEITLK